MTTRRRLVDAVARGIVWTARLVKGWLPRTLSVASAAFSIVWASYGTHIWSKGLWAFVLTMSLAIGAFVAEALIQRPSYMKLAQMREDAELKASRTSEALERALTILMKELAKYCGLEGNSDRFSVYYYHDEKFVMLARHSKNPKLNSRGRGLYPVNQGAIGIAWDADHGQALVQMAQGPARWNRAAKKQGFSDDDIAKMRMKSATVAALRIEGEGRSVGVLVFETTTPNRINQGHLDQATTSHIVTAIGELVAGSALLTPEGESLAQVPGTDREWPWQPAQAVQSTAPVRVDA